MKHIKVHAGDLVPNPFRKDILGGRVDDDKMERLGESVTKSGFWNGLRGRPVKGTVADYKPGDKIALGFGEHRRQIALRMLGKDYELWIDLDDFTDEQMLIMLANENATSSGASDGEQIDTVALARTWLQKNPASCVLKKLIVQREQKTPSSKGGRPSISDCERDKHGTEECITAFLGDKNWSRSKVHRLLQLGGLHDEVKAITSFGGDRIKRKGTQPGTVNHQSAGALAPLPKSVQQVAAAAIKAAPVGLPAPLIKEVVKTVREESPKAAVPEQRKEAEKVVRPLDIPMAVKTEVVKLAATAEPTKAAPKISKALEDAGVPKPKAKAAEIVSAAQDALIETQKEATTAAIKAATVKQQETLALEKSKDLNDVARRIIKDLAEIEMPFDEDDMKEVLRLREHLSASVLHGLTETLRRTAKKFADYADFLDSPAQKKLHA